MHHILFAQCDNTWCRSLTRDSFQTSHGVRVPLAPRLFAVPLVHFEHVDGDHVPVRAPVRKDAPLRSRCIHLGSFTRVWAKILGHELPPAGLQNQEQMQQVEKQARHGWCSRKLSHSKRNVVELECGFCLKKEKKRNQKALLFYVSLVDAHPDAPACVQVTRVRAPRFTVSSCSHSGRRWRRDGRTKRCCWMTPRSAQPTRGRAAPHINCSID